MSLYTDVCVYLKQSNNRQLREHDYNEKGKSLKIKHLREKTPSSLTPSLSSSLSSSLLSSLVTWEFISCELYVDIVWYGAILVVDLCGDVWLEGNFF